MAARVFVRLGQVLNSGCVAGFVRNPHMKILNTWVTKKELVPVSLYCTETSTTPDVDVFYRNGLPVVSVVLPSRGEKCQFTLKPLSHTIGTFIDQLKAEDRGIDRAEIYTTDGVRLAKSTAIEILLRSEFTLTINDKSFQIQPPTVESLSQDDLTRLNQAKALISQLNNTLNIEEYHLMKERQLQHRLEEIRVELEPFEQVKQQIALKSHKRANQLTWLGLGLMGVQFGFLARLVWWEYSWDIMEPVTYFVTYGTSMAMFAYYVLTKQDYVFPDVRDRMWLQIFHRGARRQNLNVDKYNELKSEYHQAELDLKRLRDPLQLNLPMDQLQAESKAE